MLMEKFLYVGYCIFFTIGTACASSAFLEIVKASLAITTTSTSITHRMISVFVFMVEKLASLLLKMTSYKFV